jgi:medium-chain acyl-[acyl-carrier-protein] hydrolase
VFQAFIDTNQHMNNAQYIRTALEYVPETFHIRQVRVEYKKAAVLHDQLHPFVYMDEQIIKILLGDQEAHPYAVVEFKNQI